MIGIFRRIATMLTKKRDPKFHDAEDRYERVMRQLKLLDRERHK